MKTIKLTDQQIQDILSSLSFTIENYEKAPEFKAALKKISKLLWKEVHEKTKTS